jgi:two-component system NtrC family response regulator
MNVTPVNVLVLEDDEGMRSQYTWLLSDYRILQAGNRADAKTIVEAEHPAIAIVDLGLPPDADGATEGLAAVSEILEMAAETKIIVVTGNEHAENAHKAVASGAYDFFQKPVDPEVLKLIVARAARLYGLERENRALSASNLQASKSGILGNSAVMQKTLRDVERVAKSEATVLITGESGTGKELVASALHRMSSRVGGPFVAINCAAIPDTLLEAELFGHEKGAFTGAIRQTIGKIEQANGGTLFLDEIGDIPLATQVKLLRFLEDRIIERVGGRKSIQIDARIVTATNQDLANLISESRFREDLYYRINEVSIKLPALRDRGDDILLLANFFLREYAKEMGRSFRGFSQDASSALKQHVWRGNVRELENRVKRAAIMSEATVVSAADLDLANMSEAPIVTLREVRRQAERVALDRALDRAEGNLSKAAGLLGISRPTLYELLDEHGLESGRKNAVSPLPKRPQRGTPG